MGSGPQDVLIGDFNGDTKPDLASGNCNSNNVSVLLNTGGTFSGATNFSAGTCPAGGVVGNFNGDANLDIAVANQVSDDVSILFGNGDGTFSGPTNFSVGHFPAGVAAADFNGDTKLDLAVTNRNCTSTCAQGTVSILLGDGAGGFSTPTDYAVGTKPVAVAVGNLNGDTRPDLAVANQESGTTSILLGVGDGTFTGPTDFTPCCEPTGVAIGDFNGDSRADLGFSNRTSSTVALMLGNGDGTFAAATYSVVTNGPQDIAAGDLNGDGKLDYATPNAGANNVSVRLGQGDGTFSNLTGFPAGADRPVAIAIADLDRDGKLDLAIAGFSGNAIVVALNTTLPGFPRPKGATPFQTYLTVAFKPCTSPNEQHGAPLAVNSCSPPAQSSDYLTVGTLDANGQQAKSVGVVRADVRPGNASTPENEADVKLVASVKDVRMKSDLSDYSGELSATTLRRIIDKDNSVGSGPGNEPATTQDIPLSFTVPCAVTADTTIGSLCSIATTANTLVPGQVKEEKRSNWQLGQVQVFDGGADGDADTTSDNTLFMDEGIFVP